MLLDTLSEVPYHSQFDYISCHSWCRDPSSPRRLIRALLGEERLILASQPKVLDWESALLHDQIGLPAQSGESKEHRKAQAELLPVNGA